VKGEPTPAESLLFLALGGAGEIGMNLNLYGYGNRWLMVDLGVTFADPETPGVDLIVPDIAWIAERREDLVALVLTHAHEDHLGAVAHLWRQLRCPVYATPFAAAILRRKLEEVGLEDEVPVHVYRPGDTLELAPFRVLAVPITHSIPESQALAIETPLGLVVHSGDWKLDPDPLVGERTAAKVLEGLGARGVLALICDSTNVFRHGESGSEAAVRNSLRTLLANRPGRVAVTTFSSNIARLQTLAEVALEHGRRAALVGRSLERFTEAARECGYLSHLPPFLDERAAGFLPRDKVLLICTGCQGEPRGAMARIASGDHSHVVLEPGDVAVFSSKIIPGNERTLARVHNNLALAGVEVVTERDAFIHVSGHPARDELAQMYRWIKPRIAVPVHGEARHIAEHVRLAKSQKVPYAMTVRNGDMLRLAPGEPKRIAQVPVGRLAVADGSLVSVQGPLMQTRRRLMHNGTAMVGVALDADGALAAPPRVVLLGVVEDADGSRARAAEAAVEAAVGALPRRAAAVEETVRETARVAVRRSLAQISSRRPLIEVQLLRVNQGRPGKTGARSPALDKDVAL
jgi:ribonuclease J